MNLQYEKNLNKKGYKNIVGLDEAGRGAWAGPIVAGCVYIPIDLKLSKEDKNLLNQIKDSKKLNYQSREKLYGFITHHFAYAVGEVSPVKIDKIGIGEANRLAFRKAIKNFNRKYDNKPDYLLVDYFGRLGINDIQVEGIKFGDDKVLSIAAASIVAKVYRDRLMLELAKKYTKYDFDKHKGYGTKLHRDNLEKYKPCPIHRKSYKPIQELE